MQGTMQGFFCPKPKHGNSILLCISSQGTVDTDYMMDWGYTKAKSSGSDPTQHLHNLQQMRIFSLKAQYIGFCYILDICRQALNSHIYEHVQKWVWLNRKALNLTHPHRQTISCYFSPCCCKRPVTNTGVKRFIRPSILHQLRAKPISALILAALYSVFLWKHSQESLTKGFGVKNSV